MKVYISSDMEGVAGVVDWEQCTPGTAEHAHSTQLLQEEINAAIEGAVAGGATEFLVNDSHSTMRNLDPNALDRRARLLSGRYKPMYMMEGLDESFNAIFFLAYHGSMGAQDAVLSHTYSSQAIAEVRIDDQVAGEAAINALAAQAYGVPIVLVTGDQTTAEETARFCPEAKYAVVKRSLSRFAAESLHPIEARTKIRRAAEQAMLAAHTVEPKLFGADIRMTVRFTTVDYCDLAARITGVTRLDGLVAEISGDNPLRIFQTFITIVLLTRGLRS